MLVRAAETSDLDALARLWHEGWHDAHGPLVPAALAAARTLASFRDRLAAALPDTFVAGPPGAPSGFFTLKGGELHQFFLSRAARGTGFATWLMAAAEAELARRGFSTAWLDCAAGNDRAARFYEKSGWVRARTEVKRLETAGGPFEVRVWIYEKPVSR